jgi:hypothetical protein
MNTRIAVCVVLTAAVVSPGLAAEQQPSVEDLLKAVRAYAASYVTRVSGTVLDERYTLMEVSTGRMQTPNRISSDLVLINLNGTAVSLRDAYAISGAKIREAQPRIPALLAEPTQVKWDQAVALTRESQKYFLAETVVRLNDPLLALRFVAPADPSKFTYSIEGKKKINGVETVGLRFQEIRGEHTKYVLGTRGNAAVSGRFWVDPATGAIHQTDFSADSKIENARVTTTYAPAQGLDFLVPSKTVETYEERAVQGGPSTMGATVTGQGLVKFEANAAYSNPRYSPIDLSKTRD